MSCLRSEAIVEGPQYTWSAVRSEIVLREDLLKPLGVSINRLARDLRVPVTRISEIVNGRRGITADTALRLARYFVTTPEFWMNLQAAHDLDSVQRRSADRIARDVNPREGA
jgi:addiction module HigA family antidote